MFHQYQMLQFWSTKWNGSSIRNDAFREFLKDTAMIYVMVLFWYLSALTIKTSFIIGSWDLVDQPTVHQLVTKFPNWYEKLRFITVFTTACHLFLSNSQLNPPHYPFMFKIHFNITLLPWPRFSKQFPGPPKDQTTSTLEYHLMQIRMWSIWLWLSPSGDAPKCIYKCFDTAALWSWPTDFADMDKVLILTPLATVTIKPQFRIASVWYLEVEVNM